MWPFRRRQHAEPVGSLRLGEHSADPEDYPVWTVSESRHPQVFARLWEQASSSEREQRCARRWASLVPIRDPRFGVADLAVQFDGETGCFLRPPHLGQVAARIDEARVVALEAPALVEWGPAGPTVRLRIP